MKKKYITSKVSKIVVSTLSIAFLLGGLMAASILVQNSQDIREKASENSQKLDVIDFMKGDFNYNGFTEMNSYLAGTGHIYDKDKQEWWHFTEQLECPDKIPDCIPNWKGRVMIRQKPGENILYQSKGIHMPGKNVETFWFNNEWVYNFSETYDREGKDIWNPKVFGLFRSFHHLPENNSYIQFPYRGILWTKRYVTPGEVTPWIYQAHTTEFRNMQLLRRDLMGLNYRVRVNYYPDWDSSKITVNDLSYAGNLPKSLEVIELANETKEGWFKENYFYAKSGSNSLGIIRFEGWEAKVTACGSTDCCTTPQCDSNDPYTLTQLVNFNILSHYDEGEDPDQYFNPSYYGDPKLESYPDEPKNGALPRGRFQLVGNGQTADGKDLKAGDWMQLTEVLTDGDWMLSKYIAPDQCPNGYQYLGSIAANYYDHKNIHEDYGWVVFCGTNKNVLLATSCPNDYYSKGWFDTVEPKTTSYDYLGNAVGGKRLKYCVHYNEFHYPKKDVSPIPTPNPTPKPTPKITPPPLEWECKEFEDKSKNYIVGRIIIGFRAGITNEQAKGIVESFGGTIEEKILGQNAYVINVPPNQEESFVLIFSKSPEIEFAELNGCNNAEPGPPIPPAITNNWDPHIITYELPRATEGKGYNANTVAVDWNGGDVLTMNISNLPPGITKGSCTQNITMDQEVSPAEEITCTLSGTPTQAGTWRVDISAFDGKKGVHQKYLHLTVNQQSLIEKVINTFRNRFYRRMETK
ncbi:Ig domain-containing protein [Patescibacteria group bacterium]